MKPIVKLIALVMTITVAVLMTRGILKPVGKTVEVLKSMSSGDITQRAGIDSKDEIGIMAKAVDSLSDNFSSMIGQIRASAEQLMAATQEVTSASQQISDGAQQQSARGKEYAGQGSAMDDEIPF